MASDRTTRRTTRARSKQPESTLPDHVRAENMIQEPLAQRSGFAPPEPTAESPDQRMPSKEVTKGMTRASSKQAEHKHLGSVHPDANITLEDPPSKLFAHTEATTTIDATLPAMPSKRLTKRTRRAKSKQRENNVTGERDPQVPEQTQNTRSTTEQNGKQTEADKLPFTVFEPANTHANSPPSSTAQLPPTRTRTARATLKGAPKNSPSIFAAKMQNVVAATTPDASAPSDAVQTTGPRVPTIGSRGRAKRTTRASSEHAENTIPVLTERKGKDTAGAPPTQPLSSSKRKPSTFEHHDAPGPEQTTRWKTRTNAKQPQSKMPLPAISEFENTSETDPIAEAAIVAPPRPTTKRRTRANSKQPEHKENASLGNRITRSIIPPVPPNKKSKTSESSEQPESKTFGTITSEDERSVTPTALPPPTAHPSSADEATTTSTTLPRAPPHPDPYFDQPLRLIIPRSKPPPHATSTALPSNAFSCSMCPSIVHGSANSIRHLRGHDVLEVQCRLCDKEFRTSDSLKGHWMRHHPEKPRMWIIGELKSYYNDWTKSGVEKWCSEWKGVSGRGAMVKGKNTAGKAKIGKVNTASGTAQNEDSAVVVGKIQQGTSGRMVGTPTTNASCLAREASVDAREVDKAANTLLSQTTKEKNAVVQGTPTVADYTDVAMPERIQGFNKKRKTAGHTTTDAVSNNKRKPITAENRAATKPQLPIIANKRTTRAVASKPKQPTTTNLPLVSAVKKVVVSPKPQDMSANQSGVPTTESYKDAAEKRTTAKEVPAKTAQEITAPRMTRKRKVDLDNIANVLNVKKPKTANKDGAEDRSLMPAPLFLAKSEPPTAELSISEVREREIERRRILSNALSRFQVHLVPPQPLEENPTAMVSNGNNQDAEHAILRERYELDDLSEDSDEDLYSNPMHKVQTPAVQAGNCGQANAAEEAMFEQVVDTHVEAYTKHM